MKDAHLTLRLPDALARALARLARATGMPKSQVAREAVARYVAATPSLATERVVRAGELARRWSSLPRLTVDEAAELEADLRRARKTVPLPAAPWE
jgi:predicted transcriptional regulator